ncbi:hypothetical protein QL285_088405 [Trifolium repens]|nr:hypothetical protein QL285_088405 [Trifolium repens]
MDPKAKKPGRPPTSQSKMKAAVTPPTRTAPVMVADSACKTVETVEGADSACKIVESVEGADSACKIVESVELTNLHTVAVPPVEITYDTIKNVTKKRETWRLGVILDDMWTVFKGETADHIELLLRDKEGDTIQATVMGAEMETWKPLLTEGKTFYMRNFRVFDNTSDYKVTTHNFRLTFVNATRVQQVDITGIPKTMFKFKDFAEILAGNYKPDYLVDAIGVVHDIRKVVTGMPGRKSNVTFTMKDLSDTVMDCTLWDALSVEFINNYNQRTETGPAVLIIKHARVKDPQGVYPVQLTNVWDGTKLLFDLAIPEISAFAQSLPKDVTYSTQNSYGSSSTPNYTQSNAGSQYNSEENFMKQARIVTISEMKKLKVDTYCVTVASTDKIRLSNQGWFFYGCTECSLKCEGTEPPFVCKKGHRTSDPLIKYKLDVEVCDSTDSAKFVFWDSSLDDLVGLTAKALLEVQQKLGVADPQEYPKNLEDLIDRKFAFRVKWQPGWGGQATVSLCKDSTELICKIQEHLPAAESSCQDIQTIEGIEEDVETVIASPRTQPNSSATGDNDTSASNVKSSGKRSAAKHPQMDGSNLDSQFSSTRTGKLIKKEKL